MAMALTFDTLQFANRLKAAGVVPAQAEAEALQDAFAAQHKEMLAELEKQRALLETAAQRDKKEAELHSDNVIGRLEGKMEMGFSALNGKIDTNSSALNGKIDSNFSTLNGKISLLQWMLGVLVTGVASLMFKAFY